MLRAGVRDLVLAEFHLKVRQSPAQGMERNAVVQRRIQIVGLVISDNDIAGAAQSGEYRFGEGAVQMTGE
jgi:hypothetical protein